MKKYIKKSFIIRVPATKTYFLIESNDSFLDVLEAIKLYFKPFVVAFLPNKTYDYRVSMRDDRILTVFLENIII
jgi:hypothetical protein